MLSRPEVKTVKRANRPVTAAKQKGKSKVTNDAIKKLASLVATTLSRRELAGRMDGKQFEGQRDLYAVLGYERTLTFEHYLAEYERGDIAKRIVNAPPQSTWRRKPVVSNDSEPDNFTDFESAWVALTQKRRVFHYLERADKLCGIGHYGALLLGTDDVRNAEDMARPMARLKHGIDSLLYLIPYTEGSAEILEFDEDPRSERFGLPSMYMIDTINAGTGSLKTINSAKLNVHWSRIIHIAEDLVENDYQGTPRLQHVFNRLYDVAKIAGGSAEIFWQAAKRILVMQARDGFTAVDDSDAMTEMMDELIHGLRRVIDVEGYEVKTLDPSEVKPDEAFRVSLALISAATGIPQRILLGSEQGKMASTQDEVNWNGRIADRQMNFAEPVVLRPFIDRLIKVGALPTPEAGYTITWPSLFELSDKEKAQIGLLKSRALAQYIGKGGENLGIIDKIVPFNEFRGDFLNLRSLKIEQSKRKDPGQADTAQDGIDSSLKGITDKPVEE